MSIVVNLYDIFRRKQASGNGSVNLSSLNVYCMLVTATYTPNQNTHDFRDDITNEVSGTNYTAGGNILNNPVIALDGAGLVTIDFDDPADWAQHASGFSDARRTIFYVNRGGAASADELIGFSNDFGANVGNVAAALSVELAANGLISSAR